MYKISCLIVEIFGYNRNVLFYKIKVIFDKDLENNKKNLAPPCHISSNVGNFYVMKGMDIYYLHLFLDCQ